MRRYSYAYTASHDFSVLDELMVPDYELWMGDSRVTGREENYRPATARVYEEFPGLGFVVHELLCSGERIALRFSEHGRSVTRGGSASWSGISLYRWDGKRLQ
jgi:predicted ester cyclase